jgi:hypothetical protein
VYRIDEQGRRIFEIDAHSDFNRPLLLRMQEAQDAAGAAFLARLRAGRLVAWAREGSPMALLRRTPADAWASLRLVHVTEGRARGHGVDLFGIRVAPAPATPRPRRPKSSRPARLGGRQVCISSGASISADSTRARHACYSRSGAFTTPPSGHTAAWAAGLRGPKQSARPLAVRRHYAPPPGQRGGRSNGALISNSDHRRVQLGPPTRSRSATEDRFIDPPSSLGERAVSRLDHLTATRTTTPSEPLTATNGCPRSSHGKGRSAAR